MMHSFCLLHYVRVHNLAVDVHLHDNKILGSSTSTNLLKKGIDRYVKIILQRKTWLLRSVPPLADQP